MGKKGGSSAPPAPDPYAWANAQAQANKEAVYESARVNQINRKTPYGNEYWSGEIGSADRTQHITLSEPASTAFNQQMTVAKGLGDVAVSRLGQIDSSAFTTYGIPEMFGAGQLDAGQQMATDRLYSQGARYLEPRMNREMEGLHTTLTNQGLAIGSEGYQRAMGDFVDKKSLAYADLRDQAQLGGAAEAGRLMGLSQTQRQQALSDRLLERQQPMNELAAILQGSPALPTPPMSQPSQYTIGAPDILGSQTSMHNAQLQASTSRANAQTSASSGLFGKAIDGIFSLSSRSLKDELTEVDIEEVLDSVRALRLVLWRYKKTALAEQNRELDQAVHLGPYAEDWQALVGLGDGESISLIDAVGVCLASIQALAERVEGLEEGA
uniref:Peptidase S74 domain-containing protein n=1 Tax=Magnetococcus massalia (strain MO-1) TaxID=451514 RepID=A0A1S7LEX6_MAGMO|nr:conserved protein of unknown function. Containing aminotransferase, class-II, pyridoxal-phosphate binding site [Candidatus Magnetococcus massalia]